MMPVTTGTATKGKVVVKIRSTPSPGWRVLSKLRVWLLWYGGFHLGANLLLIAKGAADGRSWDDMIAAVLGCILAVFFVVQAVVWAPAPHMSPTGSRDWRVLSKTQAFAVWIGGFLLGVNLLRIPWELGDGEPLARMISPILGSISNSILAIVVVVVALYFAPPPEKHEADGG